MAIFWSEVIVWMVSVVIKGESGEHKCLRILAYKIMEIMRSIIDKIPIIAPVREEIQIVLSFVVFLGTEMTEDIPANAKIVLKVIRTVTRIKVTKMIPESLSFSSISHNLVVLVEQVLGSDLLNKL